VPGPSGRGASAAHQLETSPAITIHPDALHGGLTLLGDPGDQDHQDLIPVAIRLIWDIDGVVDVVDQTERHPAPVTG
jgi:hypothetical protein